MLMGLLARFAYELVRRHRGNYLVVTLYVIYLLCIGSAWRSIPVLDAVFIFWIQAPFWALVLGAIMHLFRGGHRRRRVAGRQAPQGGAGTSRAWPISHPGIRGRRA